MNDKRAKAIRKVLNADLKQYGLTVRSRVTEQVAVPSRRYSVTLQSGEVLKNTAIRVRLQAGCPRQMYQEIKRRVSAAGIA